MDIREWRVLEVRGLGLEIGAIRAIGEVGVDRSASASSATSSTSAIRESSQQLISQG